MAHLGYFLLLIVVCSSDAASRVKRVIGGEVYEDGEFPFHVSLWYMGDNNPYTNKTPDLHHTCGGSLIADQWVLTSAACFSDDFIYGLSNTSLWEVVLGMFDQRSAPSHATFMKIDTIFINPDFDLYLSYGDLALLKLTEPAPLGEHIDLVDFNTDDDCPEAGQDSYVIGWGQTQSEEYGIGADFPSVGHVLVTSVDYCQTVYGEPEVKKAMGGMEIDDDYICAGLKEGGVDGCYGDSGSPLLTDCGQGYLVTAVMSTGYGCAQPKYPGVYTRVSAFSDWIESTIEDNSDSDF